MVVPAVLGGWFGKLVVSALAAVGTLRYGAGLYAWRETEKLERPVYTVLRKLSDGVELRQYEPYLIAETTVDGVGFQRKPTGDGFRTCAAYIFGKNKSRRSGDSEKMAMTAPVRIQSEKMAMTAPVRLIGGSKGKTKVSFVIGKEYSMQTAPKPLDRNVTLRKVPGHVLAVRTFSGPPPNDERVEKESLRLKRALDKENISPADGEILLYGYHDPFITPNILRRNEVAVRIKPTDI